MKKVLLLGLFTGLFLNYAFAEVTVERHNFYHEYNPTTTMVYIADNSSATGDQVAVNTYSKKTIQIVPEVLNEYVYIRIEGRSAQQKDTPNWAVLSVVEFGKASTDIDKQKVVDVTQFVDFLRVGIKSFGSAGTSQIDVEGIFTNNK